MDLSLASLSVYHVCSGVYGGQKKVLDALGLEIYTTMSHHVGAGNIVQVLGNSNQFS